ncbi:hypothetical protein [Bacillus sonorensis]|uniref:hypothetical protein n=1 Tax=Bacillus sonorensis TaxID=119858 RepID=UPI00227ED08F|nr:hypothetical protein [Bacillus sonorensis]MCY8035631.1 hypothetical protein [Bacillus sonorensis]MCY8563692.1 hypothetical protein [Bacillus sonorensis]
MPQWFTDHMKCLVWLFSYKGPYTDVIEKRGSKGCVVKAYEGDYIVKYKNGDVQVMSPVAFEQEFEKVPETVAKKARKMAELSGILTKNGFNFTTEIKDLPAINPGPIESPEISPANSFEIEREAHKKLIKELIREVLSEEPVTFSLDGKAFTKAVLREMGIEIKRAELRS